MKSIALIFKLFISLLAILLIAPVKGNVGCTPDAGTRRFIFNWDRVFTDPSTNQQGQFITDAGRWSLGGHYAATCACTGTFGPVYYRAIVPAGMPLHTTQAGLNYHQINPYLAVASEAYVWSRGYLATPFENQSNLDRGTLQCHTRYGTFVTGASGRLKLYFIRPFVGRVTLPATRILDIYGTPVSGQYGTVPMASVTLQGTVTVPQACRINAGQVIQVNFGDMHHRALSRQGEAGAPEQNINLTLECNNISEGVNISLALTGTNDRNMNSALATSNPDIGIRILDSARNPLIPNHARLPVILNYASQSGSTSLLMAPINTSGQVPQSGPFHATATLTAEIQ